MDDRHHSDHPKISIITATHDAARTLRACLDSVAAQTYADKEHIVIDGLSTDGTVKILEEYATRYPHIRWVSEQDGGIYDALNKGIRMASGEWTYFLGSDDTLSDDTILERIVAHIGEKDIDVFQGDVIVDRQGTEEVCSGKRETFEQLIVDGNLCHQSMFVKRSIFDRFGHFDTKYNARADYAFNLRLFADADVTRMYAPIAIARYDVHGFSSTHIDCAFAEDRKQMLERLVSPEHADAYERIMAAKDALKRKKLKHADADQRNKTVVYTAIFGGKDILQGPPPSEECDFVCFTDDENMKSDVWDVRVCRPTHRDPRRSAKPYKINPHRFLPEYEYAIWIDGSVRIKDARFYALPETILKDHDMALYRHPIRNCIYQEYEECVKVKKDSVRKMRKQVDRYRKAGYPADNGLVSGAIIFRKNASPTVKKINEDWWREIESGSVRDQLSFDYVAWKNTFPFFRIDESVRSNAYEEMREHAFEDMHETWYEKIRKFSLLFLIRLHKRLKKARGLNFTYLRDLFQRGFFVLRNSGPFVFCRCSYNYLVYGREYFRLRQESLDAEYALWIGENERLDIEKIKDDLWKFRYKPKISIITPVYNVQAQWLDLCVESVRRQLYENWELCLYDDASTNPETITCLKKLEKFGDERIKIVYGTENQHISGASNVALKLATGEFVALLDHDDELSANALHEIVRILNKHPKADFIYSDEDKMEENGTRAEPFFKPDFSLELLLTMNYITHLSVFRKSILDAIGGFRNGYDGSQDYDIILRTVERTTPEKIFHVPKILYHWRKVSGSTALSSDSKNYAYVAAKKALADYLKRNDMRGKIVDGDSTGRYRIKIKTDWTAKILSTLRFLWTRS